LRLWFRDLEVQERKEEGQRVKEESTYKAITREREREREPQEEHTRTERRREGEKEH